MKKIDFEIAETMNKMADPDLCAGSASTCSRISGYYRPVECWNAGKTGEFADRLAYKVSNSATRSLPCGALSLAE